ncbi:MAG TPA: glucose-6-phosphate dehydrogenase [Planctomycetaceae bacterium]|nr:glucose-6-phosphate dehydrogenase [Blastopirellula sp.]HAY78853.1 glucose-6-phosphate dehydrogenase [Planctomycetaceae bacterium]
MSHTIVIFGASGDLTSRKLIPALYLLHKKDRLPDNLRVVGAARTAFEHETWRTELGTSTANFVGEAFDQETWQTFAEHLFYQPVDIKQPDDYTRLKAFLETLEAQQPTTRIYYLSTSPKLYADAVQQLGQAGLADESHGDRRIVVEKPFGTDLATARQLNAALHQVFAERQVYRIDHYLGKETVQNMLVLRFANSIFEPIWNRNYIDHVQITVAEEVTVGRRGGYYDTSGVLRDMFQNHLLQLMMITAMEAPSRFDADLVRDEKVKVLRAVRSLAGADFARDTVRGQYAGYLQEAGVPPDSQTATFAAIKLHVDNWRWQGVPFYLRSGKGMSCRTTQIVIQFREPPLTLFGDKARKHMDANRLVIQVQPAEGIQLHFQTKVPDAGMRVRMTDLDFSFREAFSGAIPDAYQRLLLDAVKGDASLFARSDEVELAWSIIDPIIAAWRSPAAPELQVYEQDMWGPDGTSDWMADQGRQWFDVCPILE